MQPASRIWLWAARMSTLTLVLAATATGAVESAQPPAANAQPPPAAAQATVWGKLVTIDGKISYPLQGDGVTVGSAEGSGVVVRHASVSAAHARLFFKDGHVYVEDLGSRGGTLAAGALVKKGKPFRILQPMDLAFGAVTLKFEFGERPKVLPPTQKRMDPKGKAAAKGKPADGAKPVRKGDGAAPKPAKR